LITGRRLALKVDVIGIDANELFDHFLRNIVAQRRLVDALIKPYPAVLFAVLVLALFGDVRSDVAHVDRNISAAIGQRRRRHHSAVVG
jgi:hypothetical protein